MYCITTNLHFSVNSTNSPVIYIWQPYFILIWLIWKFLLCIPLSGKFRFWESVFCENKFLIYWIKFLKNRKNLSLLAIIKIKEIDTHVCADKWGVIEPTCIFSVFNSVRFLSYLFNEILNVTLCFLFASKWNDSNWLDSTTTQCIFVPSKAWLCCRRVMATK